jgi:hypothetical protein
MYYMLVVGVACSSVAGVAHRLLANNPIAPILAATTAAVPGAAKTKATPLVSANAER